ncbi:unnamed protein product [Nippostrongylus brasiliensis]|uniref:Copine domain-containing protein n=1 Tax=Nippostrongylus brasiliensis TaxID=27835 RepID=A0A0N4YIZ4_NIPBR|nr:unnamed protein product [Nippostrongylus brasiliensis]
MLLLRISSSPSQTSHLVIRHGALSNAKTMEAFTALRTCMLAQLEKSNQLSEKDKTPVVVVMLGVGDDIQAEKELKKMLPEWRYEHFVDILKGVLKTGRFAPIKNSGGAHQRMFLVNYADPYCVRKYLDQFFDPLLSPNAWGWEKGRRLANKKR